MNKKKWSILLAIFFLVQYLIPAEMSSATNFPLPQIKVDTDSPEGNFKNIYDFMCTGLLIYRLDAVERCTKEEIIKYIGTTLLRSQVKFDLQNMDIGKKGCTRYYPFSIGEKSFIMRIFLTEESHYQPKADVLYEGAMANPAVTFQVLPSINEILSDCKIRPIRAYSTSQIDGSS